MEAFRSLKMQTLFCLFILLPFSLASHSSRSYCHAHPRSSTTAAIEPSSSPSGSDTPSSVSTTSAPTGVSTEEAYVILSPSYCPPPARPTGTPIGQSDEAFSEEHNGLQYQQYPDSIFVLQNDTSDVVYVDLSDPTRVLMSDENEDTLVFYDNGTWAAYINNCEIEVVGNWLDDPAGDVTRRDVALENGHLGVSPDRRGLVSSLEARQGVLSAICKEIRHTCTNGLLAGVTAAGADAVCAAAGLTFANIGGRIGGYIGFVGNIFGPQVGLPATVLGVVLGRRYLGPRLCAFTMGFLTYELCQTCPDPEDCGEGTIKCGADSPCQDSLSDPNNCGACGSVCDSGKCRNGQCTSPTCNGNVCRNLETCEGSCYCFQTAGGTGFCGPGTPCSGLADCSSDFDCDGGWICAVGTCCVRNVCHPPCTMLARRELAVEAGANDTEMYSNGWGGVTGQTFGGLW